jgi:hypothetical protein
MMLLNWIMLANELHRHSRRQRKDPLADPLDAPEWDGLRWALPLLSLVAQRPYRLDQSQSRLPLSARIRSISARSAAEVLRLRG